VDEYVHYVEQSIVGEWRVRLARLQGGDLRSGERRGDRPWQDVTEAEIQFLRRRLAEYDVVALEFGARRC
jgi:hypothetical protein